MNPTRLKPSPNYWPYAIIGWFIIFAAALAAWVTVAMRQKLDLVRSDYYEEEVRFQHQLDRLNRTAALRSEVAINHNGTRREVTLRLPATHLAPRPVGQIYFYRPSNASLDFQVPLATDATGLQRIGTSTLQGGLWKVRVRWAAAGQDYFHEQVIVLDEANPGFATKPVGPK